MRAHGIGDEGGHIDEEDPTSDWEDKLGGNEPPGNKRMYALRTNPNRLKSCRVCENCGKEFLSWKSFLEHGKCSSEDAESLVSSHGSDGEEGGIGRRGCGGWSKRKRSLRPNKLGNFSMNCPSSEEEDLANCLMMLSNATVDPLAVEPEESCASASKEDRNPMGYITPISCRVPMDHNKAKGVTTRGVFECKACKKVFNSHQALGGHRASHKKVKGCFAARLDHHLDDGLTDDQDVITHEEFLVLPPNKSTTLQLETTPMSASPSKRKSKVHECSICHRIFSSGQALGGHKRCHWITSNNSPDTSSLAKFHFHEHMEQNIHRTSSSKFMSKSEPGLDLNLPAPVDDASGVRLLTARNPFSFDVSTEIYLQPWTGGNDTKDQNCHNHHQPKNEENHHHQRNNEDNCAMQNVDDEADSKVKLAKLSDLKDMNMSGGSSPWLQVGIGSTTNVGADP